MGLTVKRIYQPAAPDDGVRVLVDRLWPRGVSKDAAALDQWLREVAPSPALRRWFNHEPARWEAFRHRYAAELDDLAEYWRPLATQSLHRQVTLLYGARDDEHNHAVALKIYLERWLQAHGPR
ncbi:DUF488 domain-containing protein [Dyella sp.]|jgi:uncharacterized protein YeaO (DUF488 family)|uniref:DUF488 domain-containing protein n=1 Tax=Dyella sp. TaxID=1869338 RepID=UPI002D76F14E|nr:DUF488 family protein [Dyella sp.]HET6434013.1 DUF488 family protein [Dyella sp.]